MYVCIMKRYKTVSRKALTQYKESITSKRKCCKDTLGQKKKEEM